MTEESPKVREKEKSEKVDTMTDGPVLEFYYY